MGITPLFIRDFQSYRAFLLEYARLHKERNPRWSYSIWATKLGLKSKSPLVMVLTGQRQASKQLTDKLISYFKFSQIDASYFRQLVSLEQKLTVQHIEIENVRLSELAPEATKEILTQAWLALVVKEIVVLLKDKASPERVSNAIQSLSTTESIKLVELLVRLGFLEKNKVSTRENSAYILCGKPLKLTWTRESIRKLHTDSLQASEQAFDNCPAEDRVFQSSFVSIKKERVAEARIKMNSFQKEFMQEFEDSNGDAIFQQLLHLFPVTKTLTKS